MLMEFTKAQEIRVRTEASGVVLLVTSEVGTEVVVDEIRIKSSDPHRLLRSLQEGAAGIESPATRPAA